jgi:hypothetical protein
MARTPGFAPPPAPPAEPAGSIPPPAGAPSTISALLLLTIGSAIGWIPFVGLVGTIFYVVGLIRAYAGRNELGAEHRRFVVWSVLFFVIGIFGGGAVTYYQVWLTFEAIGGTLVGSPSVSVAVLRTDLEISLVLAAAFAVIFNLSRVLIAYAIARRSVRVLLWTGFVAGVAVSVGELGLSFLLLRPTISSLQAYGNWIDLFDVAGVVPAALFAVAYYSIRNRLLGRESGGGGLRRAARHDF